MSPKTDSETKVFNRTAWSRDIRPNASGVTYSRRSYFYDREFSDSIVRPTDNFESSPSGYSTATRYQEHSSGFNERHENISTPRSVAQSKLFQTAGRRSKRQYEDIPTRPRESSDWRSEDPFQRGRVLQSASAGDHDNNGVHELQNCTPPLSAQAPSRVQSQVPIAAVPAEPEPRWTIFSLDKRTLAKGFVVGMDTAVYINEMFRDSGEHEGSSEDDGADPYHLEAGPPRRLRPSKVPPRRTLAARKTTTQSGLRVTSIMDETQGNSDSQNCNATTTRSLLLPAGKRVCYYLIATVVFGVLASFGLALWWAQSQGDVSAGFTIGGYVIAVDALIVAVVSVVHKPGCRCWKV
ncbi:hypothetical protein F4803DRAFT_533357 [Xylaria telfairii]|nr:hypothetical protein F4803DRAFT_533357 [Xylaria telfairii]